MPTITPTNGGLEVESPIPGLPERSWANLEGVANPLDKLGSRATNPLRLLAKVCGVLVCLVAIVLVSVGATLSTVQSPSESCTTSPPPPPTTPPSSPPPPPTELCSSPACVRAAAEILNSIDPKAEPCDDFYQYACGRWHTTHPMPGDRSSYSSFSTVSERNQVVLRTALEDGTAPQTAKARAYYAKCMDLCADVVAQTPDQQIGAQSCLLPTASGLHVGDRPAIEEAGGLPVASHLAAVTWTPADAGEAGLNATGSAWSPSDWELLGVAIAHLHRSATCANLARSNRQRAARRLIGHSRISASGVGHRWPLFYSWVYADQQNSSRNVVHMGQDGLGLGSRDYYLDKDPDADPYLVAYRTYVGMPICGSHPKP